MCYRDQPGAPSCTDYQEPARQNKGTNKGMHNAGQVAAAGASHACKITCLKSFKVVCMMEMDWYLFVRVRSRSVQLHSHIHLQITKLKYS